MLIILVIIPRLTTYRLHPHEENKYFKQVWQSRGKLTGNIAYSNLGEEEIMQTKSYFSLHWIKFQKEIE